MISYKKINSSSWLQYFFQVKANEWFEFIFSSAYNLYAFIVIHCTCNKYMMSIMNNGNRSAFPSSSITVETVSTIGQLHTDPATSHLCDAWIFIIVQSSLLPPYYFPHHATKDLYSNGESAELVKKFSNQRTKLFNSRVIFELEE